MPVPSDHQPPELQQPEQRLRLPPLTRLIEQLQHFFQEQGIECYLVGGCLRDLLLGQHLQDLDLVVPGNAREIARTLADRLNGYYATLGLEKDVGRVILPAEAGTLAGFVIDLATLRGEHISDDVARRDFTINALALRLDDLPLPPGRLARYVMPRHTLLIDPFRGWRDLQKNTLRAVQPGIFQDDPLRLLRAIRLACRYHLTLAGTTLSLLRRDTPLLITAAPERIRDELLQIIGLPNLVVAAYLLSTHRLFPMIFPSLYNLAADQSRTESLAGAPESEKLAGRVGYTLETMTALLHALQGESGFFGSDEQGILLPLFQMSKDERFKQRWEHTRIGPYSLPTVLSLTAILYTLLETDFRISGGLQGPDVLDYRRAVSDDLQRLAFGQQAASFVSLLLQHVLVPWGLAPRPAESSGIPWRAARHYFQRFGERGADLALFCLVCQRASRGDSAPEEPETWRYQAQTLIDLLRAYYLAPDEIIPPALLNGEDIMTSLGLPPGPRIGALLTEVRDAQLDSLVQTRDEALAFILERAAQAAKEKPGE